jgi:hypothetical protein
MKKSRTQQAVEYGPDTPGYARLNEMLRTKTAAKQPASKRSAKKAPSQANAKPRS